MIPTYSLVIRPGGDKLARNTDKPYLIHAGRRSYVFQKAGMPALAKTLSNGVRRDIGRPVVDKTGLVGEFDFTLTWSSDKPLNPASVEGPLPESSHTSEPPLIFDALQQQLGLQLKADHESLSFVIITKAEPPTAN